MVFPLFLLLSLCQESVGCICVSYFWFLCSVPHTYVSIPQPIPHSFHYCSYIIHLEIGYIASLKWKNSVFFSYVGKKSQFFPVSLLYYLHKTLYLWSSNVYFPTPSNSLQHQLVSYNLIQFWHYLPGDSIRSHRWRDQTPKFNSDTVYLELASDPTGEGLRHPRPPPYTQMSVASLGFYLCFWPTHYRSEVPMIPSLDLINLLEQLTVLRETLTYVYLFIKGYDKEYRWIARWRDT